MKKSILPLLIMIALTSGAFGCNGSSSETKTIETQNESETSKLSAKGNGQEKDFTIDHGTAGPFALKAGFPGEGNYMGYNLVRREEARDSPDGHYTVVTYDCMMDGERHLVLVPNVESDGSEGGWISELHIYSDLYKTNAGIGVGSTIEEFYFAYEDAEALYSYVSGYYWLDTKTMKSTQFEMKEADYSEEPKSDSDLTWLDKKKYKKDAKIESIRIY